MSGSQDQNRIVSSLTGLLEALESGGVQRLRLETTWLLIDFAVDSATLRPDHEAHLDQLAQRLAAEPTTVIISLVGRASQTGSESNNESLSFNRAEGVRAHLLASGLEPSRIGPTVAHGSGRPIVDFPGREEATNRSVEIWLEWEKIVPAPPSLTSGPPSSGVVMSSDWKLDLTVTMGAGFGLGGQTQLGTLTNLRRTPPQSKPVSVWVFGLDLGKSVGPTFTAGVPILPGGEFQTDTQVDWDWFDGRLVTLTSGGAGAIVGGIDATFVKLYNGGDRWIQVGFLDYPIGFTIGLGAQVMVGVLNVDQ